MCDAGGVIPNEFDDCRRDITGVTRRAPLVVHDADWLPLAG
jgi:hypothetical protein